MEIACKTYSATSASLRLAPDRPQAERSTVSFVGFWEAIAVLTFRDGAERNWEATGTLE